MPRTFCLGFLFQSTSTGPPAPVYVRPIRAVLTVLALTPNRRARPAWVDSLAAKATRISMTSASDRCARQCAPPDLHGPRKTRPFSTMSRMLSLWLPRNRWAGLTQWRTSQRWQTNRPGGVGPTKRRCETLWAASFLPSRACPSTPYPFLLSSPVHSQQPVLGSGETCRQNRSCTLTFTCPPASPRRPAPAPPASATRAGAPARRC